MKKLKGNYFQVSITVHVPGIRFNLNCLNILMNKKGKGNKIAANHSWHPNVGPAAITWKYDTITGNA